MTYPKEVRDENGVLIGVLPEGLTEKEYSLRTAMFSPLRPWEYPDVSKFAMRELTDETDIQRRMVDLFRKYIKPTGEPTPVMIVDPLRSIKMTGRQMERAKREGLEVSQPDLILIHPAHGYQGLILELKTWDVNRSKKTDKITSITNPVWNVKTGELRPKKKPIYKKVGGRKVKIGEKDHHADQWAEIQKWRNMGYYADFCVGLEAASKTISWYFGLKF